jgi:sulfatase modifying factor 1
MQASVWRRMVGVGCLLGFLGCGSGAKPQPKPAEPGKLPAVNQPAAGAAAQAAAKPAAKKKAVKPAASNSAFPNEDPANIFVAGPVGEPMQADAQPSERPEDRFVVQTGIAGSDANRLAVAVTVARTTFPPRVDFKLPSGFTAIKEFGYAEDGLPRRIQCDKDKSVMALVSGGGATIGVDNGPPEAGPQWSAFLDPFYIDVTEVTVQDFNRFRDEQREKKKPVPPAALNEADGFLRPALGMPWGQAQAYVHWLGKELPTEVEFEKAARGPDGFRTPWGNGREVWPVPRTPATIAAVGAFPTDQSVYGVYDLAGNAREWTGDLYAPTAHQEAASAVGSKGSRNWTGPKKAAIGNQRVIKGSATDWAAWNRTGGDMSARMPDVGFRGVLRTPLDATPSEKTSKKAAT